MNPPNDIATEMSTGEREDENETTSGFNTQTFILKIKGHELTAREIEDFVYSEVSEMQHEDIIVTESK